MRRRKKAFYKRTTVIIASVLCALSALGLAGIYRMESAKKEQEQELVNWEEIDLTREAKEEEPKLELVDKDTADGQASRLNGEETQNDPVGTSGVEILNEDDLEPVEEAQNLLTAEVSEIALAETETAGEEEEETAEASVQNAINLNFQEDEGMIWPVEGNVLLDYSMEQSIYFPTLQQYKYNPAIVIQSEQGTPVLSVASGVIESIVETDETGLTMTVDLGNGYEAVYGQLSGVDLSTGSYVEAGSQIAVVAEPSIYYQIEGDNLYFQVLKDGVAVDPLDYIR